MLCFSYAFMSKGTKLCEYLWLSLLPKHSVTVSSIYCLISQSECPCRTTFSHTKGYLPAITVKGGAEKDDNPPNMIAGALHA